MTAIVYTSTRCAPCSSIKKYLDHKNIKYEQRDVDTSRIWAAEVQKLTGTLIVPVTLIRGKTIVGLNYRGINEALNG